MVSIKTISGRSVLGVLKGAMCANNWLMLLKIWVKNKPTPILILIEKVIEKWEVWVKTYGNSPIKLANKINENNPTKTKHPPGGNERGINDFISFTKIKNIIVIDLWNFLPTDQKGVEK